jgi:uncharacterized protein
MIEPIIERILAFYKRWISPALHAASGVSGACRYHPSCSEYAAAALERHGVVLGSGLAIWRLLCCNPFSRGGFDPVPGTYLPGAPLAAPGDCRRESVPQSSTREKRVPFPLRRG